MIVTTHIRKMLQDADRLAAMAADPDTQEDGAEIFAMGAAIQANHAAAELQTEWFNNQHPGVLQA